MDTNKVRYQLLNLVNNRPLCLISTLIGLKDFLLGLGFLFMLPEITQTLLYQHYDELWPGHAAAIVGFFLIVIGLVTAVTAIIDKTKITQKFLRGSALLWLFSGVMYALNGNLILAVALGFFFSAIAGYMAYYYKHAPLWAAQKKALREQFALDVTPAP